MIRKLTRQDYKTCYEFVTQKPAENLFIIGDIEAFGFEQDFQSLWGEFDENGNLIAVLLKYYENYIPFTISDFNAQGFAEIINEDPQFQILSGIESFTSKIEPYIKRTLIQKRNLFYAKLDTAEHLDLSQDFSDVKEAEMKDIPRIAHLYAKIPEFAREGRNDRESLRKSMEKGVARTYYIERDGMMVSSASTAAENLQSAMIVGVCTLAEYKRKGLATKCMTKLCYDVLSSGRSLCLFYDNPEAGKIYKRIGFQDIGKWMMYTYERVNETMLSK